MWARNFVLTTFIGTFADKLITIPCTKLQKYWE